MAGSRQNSGDDPLRLAMLSIVGFLAAAAIARGYVQEAREASAFAAWLHIRPCSVLVHWLERLRDLPVVGAWLFAPCEAADAFLSKNGTRGLDLENWKAVQSIAGRIAAVAYAIPLAWLACRSRRLRPDLSFRVVHSLDSLIRAQSAAVRTSRICRRKEEFADSDFAPADAVRMRTDRENACRDRLAGAGNLLNPVPEPVWPKPWVCALRPEDWIVCQGIGFGKLLFSPGAETYSANDPGRRMRRHWDEVTIDDASEVFEAQLGPAWQGIKRLDPVERALAAVFANFLGYRYAAAGDILNLLGEIAGRQPARKRQMRRAVAGDRSLEKHVSAALSSRSAEELERRANCHGWEYTAFIAMLEAARKNRGVVASASFNWLKKENRCLWYVLNNAHNAACCVEAAMICAHYRAEIQIGRPLLRPASFQASRSLVDEYLDSRPERIKARRARLSREKKLGEELEEFALARGPANSRDYASRAAEAKSC